MHKFLFTSCLVAFVSLAAIAQEAAYFGEKVTAKDAMQPAEFLKIMDQKGEANTKLEARINGVCQMKGCWMTLDMGNGREVMVRFRDYGFFVPKDAAGKTAIVAGKASIDTLSVETLRHYAQDAGKSKKEIDTITQPEQRVSFIANGVMIEK